MKKSLKTTNTSENFDSVDDLIGVDMLIDVFSKKKTTIVDFYFSWTSVQTAIWLRPHSSLRGCEGPQHCLVALRATTWKESS